MQRHDDFGMTLEGLDEERRRWRLSEIASFALAGVTLGAAVAVAGHYLGKNANARAIDDVEWAHIITPVTTIGEKAAPLLPPSALRRLGAAESVDEIVTENRIARAGKGDFLARPVLRMASVEATDKLIISPPVWKLEKSWRLGRNQKRRILAERKRRLREQVCLAKALYFEARSEGEKGQMAVAKVILNRVKDPKFPNTICGVVYQGAEKRNSCQFSFACDGRADNPTAPKAWRQARRIAARALKGKLGMEALAGVNFYHADYVRPRWSSAMRRVVKIGRHIFYKDG